MRIVMAALLTGSAMVLPSQLSEPAVAAQPVGGACRHVLFIGVAGSGEQGGNGKGGGTFGPTMLTLRKHVIAALGASDVGSAYVAYDPDPADPDPYLQDVIKYGERSTFIKGFRRGVVRMKEVLLARDRACPDEILLPAGYSQGAMVVVQALAELGNEGRTRIIDRVASVALVANPFAHREDSSILLGNAPPEHRGIFGYVGRPARLGPKWIGTVYEACYDYDIVCDTEFNVLSFTRQSDNGGLDKHGQYSKDEALMARLSTFVTNRVKWLPKASSQTITTVAGQPWSGLLSDGGGKRGEVTWRVDPAAPLPSWARLEDGRLTMTPPVAGTYTLAFLLGHSRVAPAAVRRLTVSLNVAPDVMGRPGRLTSGNGSSRAPSVSGDGRFVAFASLASNLVAGDSAGSWDVFVRDRQTSTTRRLTNGGRASYGDPRISRDGRFVTVESAPADAMGVPLTPHQVLVIDRASGKAVQVTHGNGRSSAPQLSDDGQVVTFTSAASDLVAGDVNGQTDVFVADVATRATTRITNGNAESYGSTISGDAAHVYFSARASNVTPTDPNPDRDIYRWTRATGSILRITASGDNVGPRTTSSGGHVVFSGSSGLVTWDSATGTLRTIVGGPTGNPDVSADGRYVAYHQFDAGLTNSEVYVWDRATGLATVRSSGQATHPAVSGDGRTVAFQSRDDIYASTR